MSLKLNLKTPEPSASIFDNKLTQLIELANRKTPGYKQKDIIGTSIVHQGRFMKALNALFKREPTIRSDVLAKSIAHYCAVNSGKLLPKDRDIAEKTIQNLKKLQEAQYPQKIKAINKKYKLYLDVMGKIEPKGVIKPSHKAPHSPV